MCSRTPKGKHGHVPKHNMSTDRLGRFGTRCAKSLPVCKSSAQTKRQSCGEMGRGQGIDATTLYFYAWSTVRLPKNVEVSNTRLDTHHLIIAQVRQVDTLNVWKRTD